MGSLLYYSVCRRRPPYITVYFRRRRGGGGGVWSREHTAPDRFNLTRSIDLGASTPAVCAYCMLALVACFVLFLIYKYDWPGVFRSMSRASRGQRTSCTFSLSGII